MSQYYVGVDLHKTVAQVCVTDGEGEVVEERRLRLHSRADGSELVDFLTAWKDGGRYVVEAVGMNRWFVNECRERGLDVLIADPAKLGLKTLGKKTDRRDAREMARRLRLGDIERHAATYYPSDEEYGVRKLVRVRHSLLNMRQQLVNQVRNLLSSYLVRPPVYDLSSGRGLAWIRAYTLPTESLTACLHALGASIHDVQEQIDGLAARIEAVGKEKPVRILAQVLPGVAAQTAATIVYELGDVARFHSARAVAAYAGLVPRVAQSADTSHHGSVTKRGSRELRWILSQWAVRLMAFNPRVKEWAKPRLRRSHRNKVRIALARRLLVGVYVMLSRGEVFSLERCLAA